MIFFSIQFFNSVIRALVQDSQISFRLNDFFSISELSLLSVVSVSFIFVSIYNFVSACFIGLRKKRKFRLIIILVLVSISNIFYYLF
ncbi:MAG: hypothetical protein ACK452_17145, partial [Bacteroidota bacterium]